MKFCRLIRTKTTPNFKSIATSNDLIVGADKMVHPQIFRTSKIRTGIEKKEIFSRAFAKNGATRL